MTQRIEQWDVDRAPELEALVAAALPGEELSEDELVSCCWDDPAGDTAEAGLRGPNAETGAVLALADGTVAVAVVWRPFEPAAGDGGAHRPGAYVKLIAVHPDARRQGRGHRLLDAAERWAWDHGAPELCLEGAPPFYLWPGIDATATEALCLADARGYTVSGTGLNLALPNDFRAPTPEGIEVRRVVSDADVAAVGQLVAGIWPQWSAETDRAIEHGCCHGAFTVAPGEAGLRGQNAETAAIGFACHSVSRAGWLGPMGTDPDHRGGGVGRALLSAVCRDLMIAEMPTTEICWAGPLRFYAKSGATVSRVFRLYRKPRP
jgi:mycothiol synthase